MNIEEMEAAALELPQDQRARLAAGLISSLPAVLEDDDDGLTEAKRRIKELKEDPSASISWDELKSNLGR